MIERSPRADSRPRLRYSRARCGRRSSMSASSVIPMIPFMGVRISWDMRARKSLFARLAASASALASTCCSPREARAASCATAASSRSVNSPSFRSEASRKPQGSPSRPTRLAPTRPRSGGCPSGRPHQSGCEASSSWANRIVVSFCRMLRWTPPRGPEHTCPGGQRGVPGARETAPRRKASPCRSCPQAAIRAPVSCLAASATCRRSSSGSAAERKVRVARRSACASRRCWSRSSAARWCSSAALSRSNRCSRIWYCRLRERRAVRTEAMRTSARTGRWNRETLPSASTVRRSAGVSSPRWLRSSTGRSDHEGWSARVEASREPPPWASFSSGTIRAPAPRPTSRQSSARSVQRKDSTPASPSSAAVMRPSFPVGGRIRTRPSKPEG
jgi:hypothetical protein